MLQLVVLDLTRNCNATLVCFQMYWSYVICLHYFIGFIHVLAFTSYLSFYILDFVFKFEQAFIKHVIKLFIY